MKAAVTVAILAASFAGSAEGQQTLAFVSANPISFTATRSIDSCTLVKSESELKVALVAVGWSPSHAQLPIVDWHANTIILVQTSDPKSRVQQGTLASDGVAWFNFGPQSNVSPTSFFVLQIAGRVPTMRSCSVAHNGFTQIAEPQPGPPLGSGGSTSSSSTTTMGTTPPAQNLPTNQQMQDLARHYNLNPTTIITNTGPQ